MMTYAAYLHTTVAAYSIWHHYNFENFITSLPQSINNLVTNIVAVVVQVHSQKRKKPQLTGSCKNHN